MDDRRIVFDADLDAYVDEGPSRPPICRHSRQCIASNGGIAPQEKYYTLPLSCIQNHCWIDKWSLATDKSHLQLQCGISLQLVLNELLRDSTITVHEYYEALKCFKQVRHRTMRSENLKRCRQSRATSIASKSCNSPIGAICR
ncbi:hypothetical protein BBBOND_0309750 [Babesia bigemina]|uniref:Uncharacterized protein n=1 Tax=Babesia bigemina TaxID=5866 RepID=A0A061DAQ7_BABBI|nr:hypothetical protein BBBOND_0309750 [Babesia bigemina]CDR97072.1 hypothetical protein BBBOND_0309750 [Babesia bigemina]|eukprot:XP_012769258.1 hypothetical protein BBBOND_0309750 [Babesia bigemina]